LILREHHAYCGLRSIDSDGEGFAEVRQARIGAWVNFVLRKGKKA